MNGSWNFSSRLVLSTIFVVVGSPLTCATAIAEDAGPARAARLTYIQGNVTVVTGESQEIPAQLNVPLLPGAQLTTSETGQAEVEFEDGSIVRLTPNTSLKLDTLTVHNGSFETKIVLAKGLVFAELRAAEKFKYAIAAGCDVLSPTENLTARIDFDQPPATFSVLQGAARVAGCTEQAQGFQTDVFAGESVRSDASDPNRYFLSQTVVQDSWDQWNEDRDRAEAAESTTSTDVRNNYAGLQGYGWSDLDANGTWYDVPETGPVWQPSMAAEDTDFDPFGYGSWVSYPGFGFVWASGYPWGWTPYRCGNWSFFGGFGWGWSPAGCGGFGFVIGSRHPVNIIKGPPSYLAIRPPQPGHGPERPLVSVHTYTPQHREGNMQFLERQIDGRRVTAIPPRVSLFGAGRVTGRSALRRDFPVNPATHTPLTGGQIGSQTARPIVIYGSGQTPGLPATAPATPAAAPVYRGQSHPERSQGARPGEFRAPVPGAQTAPRGNVQTPGMAQPRVVGPIVVPPQAHSGYTEPSVTVIQPRVSAPAAAPAPRMSAPPPVAQPRMSAPPTVAPPRMSAPPPPPAPRAAPAGPAPAARR